MTVHWFPGHMAKAFRLIEEEIKKVDFVIECRDARAPHSTRNPVLDEKIADKPRLILLLKKDLAEPKETEKWIQHLRKEGAEVLALDSHRDPVLKRIENSAEKILAEKRKREKRRGMKRRPDRALIVGVPNVGKSTIINQLSKRKAANVENRPGVTQSLQRIEINRHLSLIDSPGVLWPKFESEEMGLHCALVGSVKETGYAWDDVLAYYFEQEGQSLIDELEAFGQKRGFLQQKGKVDLEKSGKLYLKMIQEGEMGAKTWETVEMLTS